MLFAHPTGVQLRPFSFNHPFPARPSSLPGVPSPLSLSPQNTHKTGNHNSACSCGDSTTLKLRPHDTFLSTPFPSSNHIRFCLENILLSQNASVVSDLTTVAPCGAAEGRLLTPPSYFLKLQRRLPKLAQLPRGPAPPHVPSGAARACPVRAACPRPAPAPAFAPLGPPRAAGGWLPPRSQPVGTFAGARESPGWEDPSERRLVDVVPARRA